MNSSVSHEERDRGAKLPTIMNKQSTVVFRNVGQVYFPQTRVECHYSLTSDHRWNSSDWIGIFEMGWSSVKNYYTYTWALVPEGYAEGTAVDCCAVFQASYLPRPSAVEYQFVYVNQRGEVCACSRPFIFCAPKPLEELETLKEEQGEGEEELLLVVPRAQLLQSRLEECLKNEADLRQSLDAARKETEDKRDKGRKERAKWECEREAMKEEITELRDKLRHSREMLKRTEEKHEEAKYSEENLTSELDKLLAEKAESRQQIRDLEEDVRVLKEGQAELERLKDRVKKMLNQMKHDEEKRKSLQMENEATLVEVQRLQERLTASDYIAESLRRELRDLGSRQSHTQTELHQARLQVAQLTLQLSEENLLHREEQATWALEREAYKHAAESDKIKLHNLGCDVQRKEGWLQEERTEREKLEEMLEREKDSHKVTQSDAKRDLQELKASLRKVQKECEEEQMEKQDLLNCIHHLEQRLGIVSKTKSNSLHSMGIYDEGDSSSPSVTASHLSTSANLEQPSRGEISDDIQSEGDTPDLDSQGEMTQHCETRAAKEKRLIRLELANPVLSELADSPMW
ncbi:calcium-binding and coiled-coil domain-containing protein 1-like isoform 2-T2 [Pholidichthys leucotaenia]